MQYASPGETWIDWLDANGDRDEDTKLAALREIIADTARTWVRSGEVTADWADKKLAKLGIMERVATMHTYRLEAPVQAKVNVSVTAENRAEAEQKFRSYLTGDVRTTITDVSVQGTPTFTAGPEDPDPNSPNPDAPTTVQGTLDMLREILLLGNIAGPRWDCDAGTNRVLASFGLAPVPSRRDYVVEVPADVTMRTIVTAYDESSAGRVAQWRWEDGRTGYSVVKATASGSAAIDEN